jgi:hypothetical protein
MGDFDPDQVACDLISVVYAVFSVEKTLIQFHTSEGNFVFPVSWKKLMPQKLELLRQDTED